MRELRVDTRDTPRRPRPVPRAPCAPQSHACTVRGRARTRSRRARPALSRSLRHGRARRRRRARSERIGVDLERVHVRHAVEEVAQQ